jgi:hypothetical protein
LTTPKKSRPAEALKEQINRYKEFNFDSDEDETVQEQPPPTPINAADDLVDETQTVTLVQAEVNLVPATPTTAAEEEDAGRLARQIDNVKLDEVMATPSPTVHGKAPSVVHSTPATPMVNVGAEIGLI